jgi:hypothetical protein
MAKTNAQRQAEFRARRDARLKELEQRFEQAVATEVESQLQKTTP